MGQVQIALLVVGSAGVFGWAREETSSGVSNLQTRMDSLFNDAWNRLPPLVRGTLTDASSGRPAVSWRVDEHSDPLPTPSRICGEGEEGASLELARYQWRPWERIGEIVLNAHLASHYTPATPQATPLPCRHGSLHAEAVAAVLHELAHAYEDRATNQAHGKESDPLPVPSADPQFQRKSDFAPGRFWSSNKNTNPQRSPDLYEVRSSREAFAVNFEYFLLDSTYACRRPSLFRYFDQSFRHDPFPYRTCRTNTKVFVFSSAGDRPRDLDPDRIYRIDYLVASPGTGFVSKWGHSMLRLVVCAPERYDSITGRILPATPIGPKCLENTLDHVVASFRADLRGFDPGLWNLATERLPSRMFLLPFDDVFREYLYGDLRDLVAYPLSLSFEEKRDLVDRILESHWGYEGDYRFLTGNCATETRDLIASVKHRGGVGDAPSAWSPMGVKDQMSSHRWLDADSARTYASLLRVLERIWNQKTILAGNVAASDAKARKAIVSYMKNSKATDRWRMFRERMPNSVDTSAAIRDFIVMEAQVLRFQEELVKDRVFSLGRKDAPVQMAELENACRVRPDRQGPGSYGIPLEGEISTEAEDDQAVKRYQDALHGLFDAVKGSLLGRIREIEETNRNLQSAFDLQRSKPVKGGDPP
ncbi:MAG: DUF4105 domain-containing protein [Fibrobacteres bacterium]|jgi:hypothetical protein|nr:DUF4105 domain-containing protein [Fibrobacterota bacterium]